MLALLHDFSIPLLLHTIFRFSSLLESNAALRSDWLVHTRSLLLLHKQGSELLPYNQGLVLTAHYEKQKAILQTIFFSNSSLRPDEMKSRFHERHTIEIFH